MTTPNADTTTEFIVTKTTTEVFMVVAEDADSADKAVDQTGVLVQRNTSQNVRPRNAPNPMSPVTQKP